MQVKNRKIRKISYASIKIFIALYMLAVFVAASANYLIPERITVTESQINSIGVSAASIEETVTVDAKLFGKIPIKTVEVAVIPDKTLVPCGNVFGVKFFTKGVMVIRLSEIETAKGLVSPAKQAGIEVGDIIQSINGKEINTVEEMAEAVENSYGEKMTVVYLRNENTETTEMLPLLSLSDRKYKTGIWVRDSTAGIGTMTYYNPKTGEFAGLGHGICDVDTGNLMPLLTASVVDVEITDIVKGKSGSPGELKGDFDVIKKGALTENTSHGVYGVMDNMTFADNVQPLEIGLCSQIRQGSATIYCELDETGVKPYDIEITKINSDDNTGKNFVVEVTDKKLLSKTGGIVQGMSGSPVVQDGKLIGAITHVLVNNPQKGYGIFIENMLN